MAHTPGPWKAENHGKHWNNKDIDNWIITYGNDGEQIIDHCYEEADAALIAAAPDLLAALTAVLPRFIELRNYRQEREGTHWASDFAECETMMRATIAKAAPLTPAP